MHDPDPAARQAHRLLQVGIALFLVALLVGIAIPGFAAPRLALSTHLLGIMQALFFMALGLIWPRLRLPAAGSRAAFWLAVYGALAAWSANLLAALWAAGNTLMPLAAGPLRGSAVQETVIATLLRTGGGSLLVATAIVLWGLRGPAAAAAGASAAPGRAA